MSAVAGRAIAIEFKKFLMDEWTEHPGHDHLYPIGPAGQSAAAGIHEELEIFECVTENR